MKTFWNRREFLRGGAATLSLGAVGTMLPRVAHASTTDQVLVVYWNAGGWDPTYIFDPHFESTALDRDPYSTMGTVGELDFADAESRPSVREFLELYGGQTAFVNGMAIGSISHATCTRLMLTGSRKEEHSDLPTLVAAATGSDLTLPHVVLSGPRFPGQHGAVLSDLSATLTGTAMGTLPYTGTTQLGSGAEARIQDYLEQVANTTVSDGFGAHYTQYREGLGRLSHLESVASSIAVSVNSSESEVLASGLSALSLGLTRCLMCTGSLPERISWDSHVNNHLAQDEAFEKLFGDLHSLMEMLENTSAPGGGPLSEKATILVLSEMGRSPLMNAGGGKDHWPFTSAMVIGPQVQSRVYGGSDEYLVGQAVNLETGALYSSGDLWTPNHLIAAVLRNFGADPGDWLVEPH